jgi:tol-pal system protein YbgF
MRACNLRNRFLAAAALLMVLASTSVPAHAVSKEMVQLQTQVQQLLDMVQRLQTTMDTKFAVMQNLAQQTADQSAQMSKTVNALQEKLDAQTQAEGGKVDTVSGQVQSLNDSVDELKTRIAKLDKSIQDLQAQLQQLQQTQQPNPGAMPGVTAPGSGPGAAPGGTTPPAGASGPPAGNQASAAPMAQRPPLEETYQSALKDFNAGRYELAAGEFNDVVHNYPLDDLAGTSQFYLGEIAYQQQLYSDAVNNYNVVIESFSGNAKAPAAQLHKGYALLAMGKKDAGIRELRVLVQRHPQTPEAASARRKLTGMGVRATASTSH